MDGRFSDHCLDGPFCKRVERRDQPDCICDYGSRSILFSDHYSGLRNLAAHPACGTSRPVPVLAKLLEPFVGPRSLELADTIHREFGSLSRALAAPQSQLMEIASDFGRSAELILAAKRLIDHSECELHVGSAVSIADPALIDYLRRRLCSGACESLMVIFCDQQDRYIHDEVIALGTSYAVRLDPAHLFRRAMKYDAHAMLLAHNHPSGDPTPSADDVSGTRALAQAGLSLSIRFIDHLILTSTDAYSMRNWARL